MQKIYLKFVTLSFMLILFTVIYSCKKIKDATEAVNADPQSAKDYITASSTFIDIFKKVDDAMQSQKLLKSNMNIEADSCPKIIASSGGYPKTIKIIFDSINSCTSEGVTYKGTIVVQMTGAFTVTGSVENITFKNFYVNGNKVTGQGILTTTGKNTCNLLFTFQVVNATVTTSNGTITFATTQSWAWIQGESTLWPNVADDEYQVSGSASGKSSDGHSFTASIISPLLIYMGCQWKFEGGEVTISPDTGPSMTVNFGNGTCTGQAVIIISGLPNVTVNL